MPSRYRITKAGIRADFQVFGCQCLRVRVPRCHWRASSRVLARQCLLRSSTTGVPSAVRLSVHGDTNVVAQVIFRIGAISFQLGCRVIWNRDKTLAQLVPTKEFVDVRWRPNRQTVHNAELLSKIADGHGTRLAQPVLTQFRVSHVIPP